MKKLIVFLMLFAGVQMSSFAQDAPSDGPRQIGNKWAFKFTPTQMVMGELNLGIEFKLANKLSMDIEFGPTLSEVGLGSRYDWKMWDDEPITPSNVTYDGSIGYFGALGFRYYPFEKTQALNRMYVQPQFKYRVYRTIIGEDTGFWQEQIALNTQYKFFFNLGYQLWASKSFGFDFYMGVGLGYQEVQNQNPYTVTDGGTVSYEWFRTTDRKQQMLFNCGIKIGIGG